MYYFLSLFFPSHVNRWLKHVLSYRKDELDTNMSLKMSNKSNNNPWNETSSSSIGAENIKKLTNRIFFGKDEIFFEKHIHGKSIVPTGIKNVEPPQQKARLLDTCFVWFFAYIISLKIIKNKSTLTQRP